MQNSINKVPARLIFDTKQAIIKFPKPIILNVQLQHAAGPQPRLILIHSNKPRHILPASKILTILAPIHLQPKLHIIITR